jgi:hypothetical protein
MFAFTLGATSIRHQEWPLRTRAAPSVKAASVFHIDEV